MACDQCESQRASGHRFCGECGEELLCPRCAEYLEVGATFCGECGRRLGPMPEPRAQKGLMDYLDASAMVVFPFMLILLATEAVGMFFNIGDTWSFLADYESTFFLLLPLVTPIVTCGGLTLQIYWIILVLVISACIALVLYQSRGMFKVRSMDEIAPKAEPTPMYWVCLLFGSVIILELIVMFLEAALGMSVDTPGWIDEMTLPEMAFEFADAAVWEEVVSRALPMGIPMAAVAFFYTRKAGSAKYILGGFGISKVSVILIVITAVVFGLAHVDSWNSAKAIPAMLGGLAMGYLYARFGIHASILYHFITDYMTVAIKTAGEVPVSLTYLCILVISLACVASVMVRTWRGLHQAKELPLTGFEKSGDPGERFPGGLEVPGLDHHVAPEGLEPREVPLEVYVPVADGEVLVGLAAVVVDVDVGDAIAQQLEHLVDLPGGVGVPDVEAYAQLCPLDHAGEVLRPAAEHERQLGHVLDSDGDAVLPRCGVDVPHRLPRDLGAAVLQPVHRKGGGAGVHGHVGDVEVGGRLDDGNELPHGGLPHHRAERRGVGLAERGVDLVGEVVAGQELGELVEVVDDVVVRLGDDLPEVELPDDAVQPLLRGVAAEMGAGDAYHEGCTSSPSTVTGASLSMSTSRSSSLMVTSMAPRTGFLSANDTFPRVATCLLRFSHVVFPRMFLRRTERVASRILWFLIMRWKRSRVAAPESIPSSRDSSASGNIERTALRTFSSSSLGFTGHLTVTSAMLERLG